jgi:riboflavin biosynthesis pyrimidine reductase
MTPTGPGRGCGSTSSAASTARSRPRTATRPASPDPPLRHEGYGPLRLDTGRREWRLAHGLSAYPVLVVVSGSLDLDPAQAAFAAAPVRPIVLTTRAAPPERRAALTAVAEVLVYGESTVDLTGALEVLRGLGFGQILCEGGPHLLAGLTAADLVDELCLTLAPLLVGPGPGRITAGLPAPAPGALRLHHALTADDTMLLRYVRA